MDWLTDPQTWVAFLTLVLLELVLGVDNIIFISILAGNLPTRLQALGRRLGLGVAILSRILLLASLSWIIGLKEPLFSIFQFEISGRDLILIIGGLFLLAKSTYEIHQKLEGSEGDASARAGATFANYLFQVFLMDMVFSLDSVITAVGMVDELAIMIAAVIIAAGVMMFTAGPIGSFVDRHPTIKLLALSFLLMIGFTLIVEGLHQHIPKGYIYFAMAFSVFVEMLNLRLRRAQAEPVKLRKPYVRGSSKKAGYQRRRATA
ncbi:MAG: hypothetical protein A2Y54_06525 [Chloroflexi bacterium RBG_16_51_16]|nr:MAG: hypothetical protein A2Y54_06525 [Chloroflexi bacterium RBG_16_51_16]